MIDAALRALDIVARLLSAAFLPGTVLILVYVFHGELKAIFTRMRRVEIPFGEAEMDAPPNQAQQAEREAEKALSLLEPSAVPGNKVEAPPPNALLEPAETAILARLHAIAPDDHSLQIAWAVRAYAEVFTEGRLEVTYRLIFGSQIVLLRQLTAGDFPLDKLRPIFDTAKNTWSDLYASTQTTFESWQGFLVTQGMISVASDTARTVSITSLGRAFLHWMIERGVFQEKVL